MRVHFLLLLLLFTGIFCAQGQGYLSPIKASQLKSTKQIFLNEKRSLNARLDIERRGDDLCDDVKVINTEQDFLKFTTKDDCSAYKVECLSQPLKNILLPNYELPNELSTWTARFNIFAARTEQKYVLSVNTQDEAAEMEFSFEYVHSKKKWRVQFSIAGKPVESDNITINGFPTITISVVDNSSVKIQAGVRGEIKEYLKDGSYPLSILNTTKFKYVAQGGNSKAETRFGNFNFRSKQIVEKNTQVNSQENSEQESSYKNNCVFLSIANDKYNVKPLGGAPTDDAKQLIEFYKRNGFDTVKIENFKTKRHLIKEITKNKTKIKNADVLIVHYGGHGAILDGNEHYLLPTSYKSNDRESRVEYPTTTYVMEMLQDFLSEGSQRHKLMHFTADACQDIVPTQDRAQGAKLTDWNVRLDNNSKVYSILRQSTFAQETADNLNGYSDGLIDHLREYEQLNTSIQDIEIRKLFLVKSKRANDKYFGPHGEIGSYDREFINDFKLNMSFDEYIRKNPQLQ